MLSIPKTLVSANNSSTFKPYDPTQVRGDTNPVLPDLVMPSGGGGGDSCGGLGQILMTAIAIVVAVYSAGTLAAAGSLGTNAFGAASLAGATTGGGFAATMAAGGAVLGGSAGLSAAVAAGTLSSALGSVASQAFGVVTGMQSDFNWSAVGLAAISGGVGAGMGALGSGTGVLSGNTFGMTAARAAVGSALTQGIAVTTGLQQSFDWSSVAASAVGAGVGYGMNANLPTNMNPYVRAGIASFAAGTAAAVARGGTVSIRQVSTDVFGQSLASAFVDNMGRAGTQENRLTQSRQENFRASEINAQSATTNGMTTLFDGTTISDAENRRRVDLAFSKGVQYAANDVRDLSQPAVITDTGGGRSVSGATELVTGEQVLGAEGTPGLRATNAVRSAYADALARVKAMDIKPIFDPNDPHQYLIFVADDGTRNDANQAITTNPRTLFQLVQGADNNHAIPIYVSGVGTENDLGGLNSALGLGVPVQISETMTEITKRVNAVSQADSEAKFVFADTGFSRGSGVIRAVQNALVQQGIPDLSSGRQVLDSDGNTKTHYDRNLIEPGKVNIGASMLYDTVTSGVGNFYNLTVPSQVQQTLHLTAINEYRTFFPLTSALKADGTSNGMVTELSLPGAHTNIGGGSYDQNGLGAANLEIGYTYLQRAGVPLAPLPMTLRPNPSQFVIHDSRWMHDIPFGELVNNPNAQRLIKH